MVPADSPWRNLGQMMDALRGSTREVLYPTPGVGSPQLLADMVAILEGSGFAEGNSSKPGAYVIEKAFVEK